MARVRAEGHGYQAGVGVLMINGHDIKPDFDKLSDWIVQWADRELPDRPMRAGLVKLCLDEIPELWRHFRKEGKISEGELADCFIILMDIAKRAGIDAMSAVYSKMLVNSERKWQRMEDGTYQHVEEKQIEQTDEPKFQKECFFKIGDQIIIPDEGGKDRSFEICQERGRFFLFPAYPTDVRDQRGQNSNS